MNKENARRLASEIDPSARVVDVGGGASPFPRANYVIDALPFDKRGSLGKVDAGSPTRYTRDTWRQVDLCDRQPWPFPDKFFDFATCSHLLEDIRDPVWVCSELCRIAKAGYIEFPSRVLEQTLGVEHPSYAGYYHHRWLIDRTEAGLEFRHKPHSLHSVRDAIVASVGVMRTINPKHAFVAFEWEGTFTFREVLEFDEHAVIEELCETARRARALPELTIPVSRGPLETVRRLRFYRRLRRGVR